MNGQKLQNKLRQVGVLRQLFQPLAHHGLVDLDVLAVAVGADRPDETVLVDRRDELRALR